MTQGKTIFLYGAPAAGKTTLGSKLAASTGAVSIDLDERIVRQAGMSIAEYFEKFGEAQFRKIESDMLRGVIDESFGGMRIVSLGGGTLLSENNRQLCELAGDVICLDTPDDEELERRINSGGNSRPLGNASAERASHYASFPHRISSVFEVQESLMVIGCGIAKSFIDVNHTVFDETVLNLHFKSVGDRLAVVSSGETHKTLETVAELWRAFGNAGVTRNEQVISCGGGVTGDLTGFAAATWMRGIPWINVPTTLLAMVDASIGGKTGFDLAEGKNLVGAFHEPRLVVIDTDFLQTLPERELRAGKAEMLKHCIIEKTKWGFEENLSGGVPSAGQIAESLSIKAKIVEKDPFDISGARMLLNCGHTIGHAVEAASGYGLLHGEAVAIGCVEEARIAVRLGLAPAGWPDELADCFQKAGLPVALPEGMSWDTLLPWIRRDKKCAGNEIRMALPCGWGNVRIAAVPVEYIV